MPRVNVWIPDDLHKQAKAAGLNISAAAQTGIRSVLDGQDAAAAIAYRDATGLDLEITPGRWAQAEEAMRPVVDCTDPGVPAHPTGFKIRHVGEKKQLDYGPICTACNRAWR